MSIEVPLALYSFFYCECWFLICPRGSVSHSYWSHSAVMMTSSNGNIFHVTGHLCGEFTGLGEFPTQRPVTRSFDAFFDLSLNKRLSKQLWGWWFETPPCPWWCHCNGELSLYANYNPKTKVAIMPTNIRPVIIENIVILFGYRVLGFLRGRCQELLECHNLNV